MAWTGWWEDGRISFVSAQCCRTASFQLGRFLSIACRGSCIGLREGYLFSRPEPIRFPRGWCFIPLWALVGLHNRWTYQDEHHFLKHPQQSLMIRTNDDQVHTDVVTDDDPSEMRAQAMGKLVLKGLW